MRKAAYPRSGSFCPHSSSSSCETRVSLFDALSHTHAQDLALDAELPQAPNQAIAQIAPGMALGELHKSNVIEVSSAFASQK